MALAGGVASAVCSSSPHCTRAAVAASSGALEVSGSNAKCVRGGFTASAFTTGQKLKKYVPVSVQAAEVVDSEPERLRLNNLPPQPGSRNKRTGRGIVAGQGASCGFGMRGQKSRSGPGVRPGFEGGQMPLYRRIPKLKGIAGRCFVAAGFRHQAAWLAPQQSIKDGNSAAALQSLPRSQSCAICYSHVRTNCSGRWSVRRKETNSPNRAPPRRDFWLAKAGEEDVDLAPENVNSRELKSDAPKGFGTSKPLATDKKRSSSRSPSSLSGSIRRTPPSKPLITTQAADQQKLKTESTVVTILGILFLVIILQGIVLAASGFLPEEYDQVVSKWLYPAFSPTVGTFFFIAAGYGVWKFYRGGTGVDGS